DPVGGGEPAAELDADVHGPLQGQRAAADKGGEVLALKVLHDKVGFAGGENPRVVDFDDVLLADAAGALGFLEEAGDRFGFGGELCPEHLDSDRALGKRVDAPKDNAHPSLSDLRQDAIALIDEAPYKLLE